MHTYTKDTYQWLLSVESNENMLQIYCYYEFSATKPLPNNEQLTNNSKMTTKRYDKISATKPLPHTK